MFWEILNLGSNASKYVNVYFGYVSVQNSFFFHIFMLIGVIVAIAIHEFAHAWSAYALGDKTAYHMGRLTLNPIKHFDALGIFLLVFSFFSYGKPVPVNPNNFKNPVQGLMLVSFAGPLSNIIQAVVYGILFVILRPSSPSEDLLTTIIYTLPYIGAANISLAIFNMLPIAPLDGSKIWSYFHYKINVFIETYINPYAIFILIALIIPIGEASLLTRIINPFIRTYFSFLVF